MVTYETIKICINRAKRDNTLDKESWMKKLDMFMIMDRITVEQYEELTELVKKSAEPVTAEEIA